MFKYYKVDKALLVNMKLNKCHLLQGPEGPVGPGGNRGLQVNFNFICLGIKSTVKTSHNALKNDKKVDKFVSLNCIILFLIVTVSGRYTSTGVAYPYSLSMLLFRSVGHQDSIFISKMSVYVIHN